MLKNKKDRIEFIYYLGIFFVITAVIIPWIELGIVDAVIVIIILYSLKVTHSQYYEYKNLSTRFETQQSIITDILRYCPDLIFYKDNNLKYIDCNNAFLSFVGQRETGDIRGKKAEDFFDTTTAAEAEANDTIALKSTKPYTCIQTVSVNNKELHTIEVIRTPIFMNNKLIGLMGIGRDITKRELLRTKLIEKHTQLASLFENIPFLAYLKDLNGNILICNRKFRQLLGSISNDKQFNNIIEPEEYEELLALDDKIMQKKGHFVLEKEFTINGSKIWGEVHKTPVLDSKNNVTGIIVIAINTTLEKEIEDQKETFVATLTHDLKTPASAQIRALQLILDKHFGDINPRQEEILKQTLNSCKYMHRMISTILCTYKEDLGYTQLNYEKFNIKMLLEESIAETSYLAEEKFQLLNISTNTKNEIIEADKLGIKRVIINLLSNAITYSPPNTPIEISLKTTDKDVTLKIHNASVYIPESEMVAIFEKYITKATKFRQIGTGLGLYLSKSIVEKHSGKMISFSEKGAGNTFGFVIPSKPNLNKS